MRSIALTNSKKTASTKEYAISEFIHAAHTGYLGHQVLRLEIQQSSAPIVPAIEGTTLSLLRHRSDVSNIPSDMVVHVAFGRQCKQVKNGTGD